MGRFLGNWISILDSDTLDSFGFLDSHGFLHVLAIFGTGSRVTQPLGWLPMVHRPLGTGEHRVVGRLALSGAPLPGSERSPSAARYAMRSGMARYDRALETQR